MRMYTVQWFSKENNLSSPNMGLQTYELLKPLQFLMEDILSLTDDDSELHLDFDQKKFDPHILHPKQL